MLSSLTTPSFSLLGVLTCFRYPPPLPFSPPSLFFSYFTLFFFYSLGLTLWPFSMILVLFLSIGHHFLNFLLLLLLFHHLQTKSNSNWRKKRRHHQQQHLPPLVTVLDAKTPSLLVVITALSVKGVFLRWIIIAFGSSIALGHEPTSIFFSSCCIHSSRQRWFA